jgi:hypothetical protein
MSMSTSTPAETVKSMYAAFGRGDVPAILENVADDVEWRVPGPSGVPWFGARRGRDGAASFFQAIGASVEMRKFEPRSIVSEGDRVATTVQIEYVVRKTGRAVSQEMAHLWEFRGGKVARFTSFEDTAQIGAAVAGT